MARRLRGWLLWGGVAALLGAAVVYESLRSRPALAENVQSRPPVSAEETSRLESGFRLSASREGRALFDLVAQSQLGMRGGANYVKGVDSFTFYTDDGRPVVVRAARGRIQQVGAGEQDIQAALEGDVVVEAPDGVVLRTDELVYDTRTRQLTSPRAARVVGQGVAARLAGFTYAPDGRVVEATGPVEVEAAGATMWRLDAGRALYHLDRALLELVTPFRAQQPGRTLLAGPATLLAPEAPETARLKAAGPALIAGRSGTSDWQIAAGALDAEGLLPRGESAVARVVRVGPPASLAVRQAGSGTGYVRTETWLLESDSAGRLRRALAGPQFEARWNAAQERQIWDLAGEWLELRARPDGEPEHAEARGRVRATGADGTLAEADVLRWDAARPDDLVLTGESAHVRRGADLVEARSIVLDRVRRQLVATDGPLTEAGSLKKGDGALFRGEEPVRVRSARVSIADGDGPIDFTGPVQAWQADATLRSEKLLLLRAESRLLADGKVQLSMPVGDPGARDRRRVRLATEHLDYDGSARIAVLTGGATYEEPQTRIESERMTVRLAADGGVDELTASGGVRLQVQGNLGRADRVEWRGGREGIVTLFGETAPAVLESPAQGNLKQQAARIRYDLAARRGTAEGRGGRTTLEGTPPPKRAP